jgi:hypothetical protein
VALIAIGVALARCSENGKQGCKGRGGTLPRMEFAALKYLYENGSEFPARVFAIVP